VKKNGGRIESGWDSRARASVFAGYGTFPEIRNMIAPHRFYPTPLFFLLLAVALAGLLRHVYFALVFVSFRRGSRLVPRQHRHLLMTVTFGVTVRFLCSPLAWALALPLAALYYGYATCVSARALTGSVAAANGRVVSKHHAETSSHDAASKFVVLRIEICYSVQRVKYRAVSRRPLLRSPLKKAEEERHRRPP